MNSRRLLWSALGAIVLFAVIAGAWIFSLPPAPAVAAPPAIAQDERDATVAALKPPKRQRPLIAIIGINNATETTDYLMPYGILTRADVADVVTLATAPGPVTLFPTLKVEPQATVAEFDARHPDGADYVIVPAMSRDDDPEALQWIRNQSAKKAIIIGVCAGAKVVGDAGLLHGKRATTHWYSVKELRGKHPTMRYVEDRRLVVDGGVATTTGISASMPMSLTLIEAIAGPEKAKAVGRDIGLADWDARHESDAFKFTRPFALTAIRNTAAFWTHERLGIELKEGVDEVSLALVADAWSRTYRSQAVTFARAAGAQQSRNGIRILPDEVATSWPAERRLPSVGDRKPAEALDNALQGIAARYGTRTTDFVAMQLEYPRHRATQ
ncbi:DJ-1/PfpI family protein [Bradyrhizobium sp. AUGA SZCCT0283]|uniref:DJ-1/PfpI family protein n=1 Tax=Bradyrhizobium sp. AUGA SZCCT0283 TaxID=2807671 RepID=UPI001BAB87BE|nr:DJ-1/PfpI family protein [Bradyrhizobium sp. AUGA SZCCT0283]MBR1275179.1 DJ-1/PfpI family protein [Bradyrhizobium sp. AUGA SZCCT0283]